MYGVHAILLVEELSRKLSPGNAAMNCERERERRSERERLFIVSLTLRCCMLENGSFKVCQFKDFHHFNFSTFAKKKQNKHKKTVIFFPDHPFRQISKLISKLTCPVSVNLFIYVYKKSRICKL